MFLDGLPWWLGGKEHAWRPHEMQETWVQSSGREDLLEEEMVALSSIFAWKIPWTEEPDGSMGSQD